MTKLQVLAGLFGSGTVAVVSLLAGLSSMADSMEMPADGSSSSVSDYSPGIPSTSTYEDPFDSSGDRLDSSNPESPWYDDGQSLEESLCSSGAFAC